MSTYTLSISPNDSVSSEIFFDKPGCALNLFSLIFPGDQSNRSHTNELLGFITSSFLSPYRKSSEAFLTMLATEDILRRDWELPEENEAWVNL
jgi:hypothetical protein